MLKAIAGFIVGIVLVGLTGWMMMPHLMFTERVSPFGMEETVARIQHNIQNTGTAGPCPVCATRPRRYRAMAATYCRC